MRSSQFKHSTTLFAMYTLLLFVGKYLLTNIKTLQCNLEHVSHASLAIAWWLSFTHAEELVQSE